MTNLVDNTPRALGALQVNPLAFGCWRVVGMSATDAQARYEAALDSGMNLIDTADVYGFDWGGAGFGDAEQILGQVLKQSPGLRQRMVLASKGGIMPGIPYDSGRLATACEESLQRLGVEQLDLYQIHRPDMLSHPQETARVLEDLRSSGKVREVGVSNHLASQVAALMSYLPFPLASQQPEYSALHLDPLFDGIFDQCMRHQTAALVWSPLAGGRLGDVAGLERDRPQLLNVLRTLSEREGESVATIALAFALAHPVRPVAIVGTTQPERIVESTQALQVTLDRTDVYNIVQASQGQPLP